MQSNEPDQQSRFKYLVDTAWEYKTMLIVPALVGFVLATFYAFFLRSEMWTARQSFIVRDDLLGQVFKPGRFESQESLMSAQETILEISRRPLVVRTALEKLGSDSYFVTDDWVTDQVIEKVQGQINFSAPNGAEFGTTEVIVLTAQASSRERSRKFIELLSEEISAQTNRIRSLRLTSMESELKQSYMGASGAQLEAMARLKELDETLGPDIAAMNALNDSQAGEPSLQREIGEIKAEMRSKQSELAQAKAMLSGMLQAFENPGQTELSSALLSDRPRLQKMQDDLSDIQRDLALARGRFQDRHGEVKGLKNAIAIHKRQIHNELTSEIEGAQSVVATLNREINAMQGLITETEDRLVTLSESRTEYLSLTAQVTELTQAALEAKTNWGQTKSLAEAARTVGLITPMDEAEVSSRPDGISKRMLALAGFIGGLMVGIGWVMMVAPGFRPGGDTDGTPAPLPPRDPQTEPSRRPNQSRPARTVPSNTLGTNRSAPAPAPVATPTTTPPTSPVGVITGPAAVNAAMANGVIGITPTAAKPAAPSTTTTHKKSTIPAAAKTPAATTPNDPLPASSTPAAAVRPVDLIKSAQQATEFVRVPTDSTPPSNDSVPAKTIKQNDSKLGNPFLNPTTPEKARELIGSSMSRSAGTNPPASNTETIQRLNESTLREPTDSVPSGDLIPVVIPTVSGQDAPAERQSDSTIMLDQLPFSPSKSDSDGDNPIAIPDQIRKLSDSISRFGKE